MERTEAHPIEIALVVIVLAVEAALTLARAVAVPVVAVVLTLAGWRPGEHPQEREQQSPERVMREAVPMVHPLQAVASELQELSSRELMALAGTRRKVRKAELIGMVAACS